MGFGGSYTMPLPLVDGVVGETPDGARHRLRRSSMPGDPDGTWLLERAGPVAATDGRAVMSGDWQPQYGFGDGPVVPADIAQANHWTATRPDTRFTSLHIVSRVLPQGFAAMTDRQLTTYSAGATESRVIDDTEAYRAVLEEVFGIALARGEIESLPLFR